MHHAHRHYRHRYDLAFKLGIALNLLYVVGEAGSGFVFDSMALISDAGHNLGDVLALALAWGGLWLSRSAPTERRTYGMKRATILASLISAVLLCLALGAVVWESLGRLSAPVAANGPVIMIVAGIGVVVNGVTAAMFLSGRHRDLNIKGAFLHMAADALVSLGVLVAGGVILASGWAWVDPVVALVVAALILVSGIGLLRESLDLAMDAVPRHVDTTEVRNYLQRLPGVTGVHDLHIWGMSTTETALTVHLVVPERRIDDAFLQSISEQLIERFSIHHPTIQIEDGAGEAQCIYSAMGCASRG